MKTNTNIIASSPNINGNIGQCQINSTDITVSTFYTETIAVNSCTGHVISSSQPYLDGGWIMVFVLLSFLGLAIIGFILSAFVSSRY